MLQNLGRFTRILPPGINIVNPVTERVLVCSRQTQILEVVQPVITKDNVTCRLLSIVYYRVVDPLRAIYSLEHGDVAKAVREMAFAAVRTVAGENLFETLVAQRSKIAHELLEYSNKQVAVWGVYIESIFLKGTPKGTQICSWTLKRKITYRWPRNRGESVQPPSSQHKDSWSRPSFTKRPPRNWQHRPQSKYGI